MLDLGMFNFKTVPKHPAIREYINTLCTRAGMVGNKDSSFLRSSPLKGLALALSHKRPDGILAQGSWHIKATPQSLAELGHLAYIGTKTSSERKDILFLGVLSQLKDLAFPVDYSEVGEPKKNLQSFTFIFLILVFTPAFFNLDPSLLTLTFVKSDQM